MEGKCNHDWQDFTYNKYKCSKCGKLKFKLFELDVDTDYIIKDNGTRYKVRKTRKNYFYPDEWNKFMKELKKDEHKLFFDFLIKTGARVEEALLTKREDLVDDSRHVLKLRRTKSKAKKRRE